MNQDNRVTTADKVRFLASLDAYPGSAGPVSVKETHMSWVFLVDEQVYKLKKPVCYPFFDFGTIEAGLLSDWQVIGLPILDAVDYLGSNILLPMAGLLVALSVGWRLRGREAALDAGLSGLQGQLWLWLIRVIVPAAILVILVTSMASL